MGVNTFDIKLLNGSAQEISYYDVETVTFPKASGSGVVKFTAGEPLDSSFVQIAPDFTSGNMLVDAPSGYVVRDALILKPSGMEAVIAKGASLMGVDGSYVTPGTSKSVTLDFASGSMSISAVGDERWAQIDIAQPATLLPENIKKNVTVAGIVGNYVTPGTTKAVTLDFSGGDMSITASGDERWNQIDIFKPVGLVAENIKKGVEIANISGIFEDTRFHDMLHGTLSGTVGDSEITAIGSYKFYGMSGITEISFPACQRIEQGAFGDCGISSASFSLCSYIGSSAFLGCAELSDLSFPQCTQIGSYAFSGCTSLSDPNFANVTSIGIGAFGGVTFYSLFDVVPHISFYGSQLVGAIIHSTTFSAGWNKSTAMQSAVFIDCTFSGYKTIPSSCFTSATITGCAFPEISSGYSSCFMMAKFSNVSFPGSYLKFSGNAFAMASLTSCSIWINNNASSLFWGAKLNGCYLSFLSMTTLVSSMWYNAEINNTTIKCGGTLNSVSGKHNNVIFDGTVDTYALANANLTSCSFNTLITGSYAFYNATLAGAIDLTNAKNISNYEFYLAKKGQEFANLSAPNVTQICSSAFLSCTAFSVLSFPAVTTISASAFYSCTKLESLYLLGESVATLQNFNAFTLTPMSKSTYLGYFGSIYVRASLLDTYKATSPWTIYSNRFVGLTDDEISALSA